VAQWRPDDSSIEYGIYAAPRYGGHGRDTGNLLVLLDIAEWKLMEQKLRRATQALKTHSLCNAALMRAKDESSLLPDICRIIVEEAGYRQAWVGLLQGDDSKSMQQVAWHSVKLSCDGDQTAQNGEIGITTGKTYVTRDLFKDAQSPAWQAETSLHEIASAICLPLNLNSRVIGALTIEAQEPYAFDADEVRFLEELAGYLSLGIKDLQTCAAHQQAEVKLWESVGKVRKTIIEVVQAMALTLEIRDPYTGGHQRRVAQLAVAIAEEMGLDKDRLEGLRVAGFMHDIGKIAVPAEILSKPSKLSKYEFGIVKGHAQVGYEILSRVSFPWPVAQIVLQHHETLDGSGYPQGLREADILPEAKILAVADVVEAMASHRPYRPALGIDKALEEITKNKGKRYDPEAVDACIRLFTEKGFNFECMGGDGS
jgi:putative nucleotidyltransferase with HDIG domain